MRKAEWDGEHRESKADPRDVFGPRWQPRPSVHAACLEDAWNVLRRSPMDSDAYRETLVWLHGQCWSKPTFSFVEMCHILGFEPVWLREKLLEFSRGPRDTGYLRTSRYSGKPHRLTANRRAA